MAKKSKQEKKLAHKIDSMVVMLYGLVIAAAVIRELMDRRREK